MNELKTEDVMRALEELLEEVGKIKGAHKPYLTIKHALALLREKDAEIEKQKALKKIAYDNNHNCYRLGYEDAITEFAERLKAHECLPEYPWDEPFVLAGCIDQIAKEMKEGD